jgi:hypothetical protein
MASGDHVDGALAARRRPPCFQVGPADNLVIQSSKSRDRLVERVFRDEAVGLHDGEIGAENRQKQPHHSRFGKNRLRDALAPHQRLYERLFGQLMARRFPAGHGARDERTRTDGPEDWPPRRRWWPDQLVGQQRARL